MPAAAQPRPVKQYFGWEEADGKEFLKAIRQPLLLQTPLQVVIETMFSKMQQQAAQLSELHDKVERLSMKEVSSDEIMGRIRLLEHTMRDLGSSALSPFNQQDILARVSTLEAQSRSSSSGEADATAKEGGATSSSGAATPGRPKLQVAVGTGSRHDETSRVLGELEPRLQRLESKMAGVYNLNGKLLAMEQMAAEMHVHIPDLEYPNGDSPNMSPHASHYQQGSAALAPPSPSYSTRSREHFEPVGAAAGVTTGTPRGWGAGPSSRTSTRQEMFDHRSGSPLGSLAVVLGQTSSPQVALDGKGDARLMAVVAQLDDVRTGNAELRSEVTSLREQVQDLKASISDSLVTTDNTFQSVASSAKASTEQLAAEVASLRKDLHRNPEVSFADFSMLQSQVGAALEEAKGNATLVKSLRENELPAISAQLNDLKDQTKKGNEPRDMDTLFHSRITALESVTAELSAEVKLSILQAMEDVVKYDDLHALEDQLASKANALDLKMLANKTTSLASSMGTQLAEALSGRGDLPMESTGAVVVSKFKCMTCEQPIRTPQTGPNAKGSFLPKLDAMPSRDGSTALNGPGVNTAEHRKNTADARGSNHRLGSPGQNPSAAEMDEYLSMQNSMMLGPGDGRHGSPGRRGGTAGGGVNPAALSGRVAVTQGKPVQPGGGRTPVFI